MKMKPSERLDWIEAYARKNGKIEGTDPKFVTAYTNATGVTFTGARCQRLYEDLVSMVEEDRLRRVRKGSDGVGGWIYIYFVPALMAGSIR